MIDIVARRYHISPFHEDLKDLWLYPDRAALLQATVETVRTDDQTFYEGIFNTFPELITQLLDSHATFIVNHFRKKPIKSMFKKKPIFGKKKKAKEIITVPDIIHGGFYTVEVID